MCWPEIKCFCVETCGWEQQSRLIGTSWEKGPSAHTYLTLIHLLMLLMTSRPEAWRSSSPVEYRATSAWKGWASSSRTQCWKQITVQASSCRRLAQFDVCGMLLVCRHSCVCVCSQARSTGWFNSWRPKVELEASTSMGSRPESGRLMLLFMWLKRERPFSSRGSFTTGT